MHFCTWGPGTLQKYAMKLHTAKAKNYGALAMFWIMFNVYSFEAKN